MTTLPLHPILAALPLTAAPVGASPLPIVTPHLDAILTLAIPAVLAIMGIATLLAAYRLLRGPSLPDRVVALDLIGTLAVGGAAVYAILEAQPVLLIVSVVLALLMFVGTVAFAYYLDKGAQQRP